MMGGVRPSARYREIFLGEQLRCLARCGQAGYIQPAKKVAAVSREGPLCAPGHQRPCPDRAFGARAGWRFISLLARPQIKAKAPSDELAIEKGVL